MTKLSSFGRCDWGDLGECISWGSCKGPHALTHGCGSSMQVYEKKVSSLSNFNIENRQVPNSGARVNALNMPRLTKASLHLPKVRKMEEGLLLCP